MLPNILSLTRIVMVPAIITSYILGVTNPIYMKLAVGLFGGSAITDMLDGKIARKFHLQSDTGTVLDAFADKFLLFSMVPVLFLHPNSMIQLLLGIMAMNEVLIASVNLYGSYHNCNTASSYIGKVKTWFLFLAMGGSILSNITQSITLPTILLALTNIGLEYATFKNYLDKYKGEIREQEWQNLIDEDNETIEIVNDQKQLDKTFEYNPIKYLPTDHKQKSKSIGAKNKLHHP